MKQKTHSYRHDFVLWEEGLCLTEYTLLAPDSTKQGFPEGAIFATA